MKHKEKGGGETMSGERYDKLPCLQDRFIKL